MWSLWLIVGITFAMAELAYSGFFLIWFAIGSIFAFIASFFTDSLLIQTLIFAVISTSLLLTLTQKLTYKFTNHHSTPTNINALIGRISIVTHPINTIPGQNGLVKLDGEIWTATSLDPEPIEAGCRVVIKEIRGVRVIVSKHS